MFRVPRLARLLRVLCLLAGPLAALQACGGRSDTDDYLFDDEGGGGVSSTAGVSTGAVSGGGKKPGDPGAGGVASGANAGGASRGGRPGTGGSSAAGGVTSAGASQGGAAQGGAAQGGAAQGGAAQGGAAQGGAAQGGVGIAGSLPMGGQGGAPVTCGASVCDALVDQCCVTLGGFACIPEDQQCSGAVLQCGASSDCDGGDVCCLRIVGDTGTVSSCKNACAGMGAGRERQLCTNDDECRGNRRCRDTVFGISVCSRL